MSDEIRYLMEDWQNYIAEPDLKKNQLYSPEYITGVLGIRIPLHESYPYSFHLNKQILQEQLLFENFFRELWKKGTETLMSAAEGIAAFGKEAWTVLSALYEVVAGGGEAIKSFIGSVAKRSIAPLVKPLRTALNWLVVKGAALGMPTFAQAAQKGIDVIKAIRDRLEGLKGWKAMVAYIGYAVGIHWLWNKIGDWIEEFKKKIGGTFKLSEVELARGSELEASGEPVPEGFKDWIMSTGAEKLKEIAGEAFKGIVNKLTGSFTGLKPWWDMAVKIAGGVELVIDALGDAAVRFLSSQKSKKQAREMTPEEAAGQAKRDDGRTYKIKYA